MNVTSKVNRMKLTVHNESLPEGCQIWVGLNLAAITIVPTIYKTQLAGDWQRCHTSSHIRNSHTIIIYTRIGWIISRTAVVVGSSSRRCCHRIRTIVSIALATSIAIVIGGYYRWLGAADKSASIPIDLTMSIVRRCARCVIQIEGIVGAVRCLVTEEIEHLVLGRRILLADEERDELILANWALVLLFLDEVYQVLELSLLA